MEVNYYHYFQFLSFVVALICFSNLKRFSLGLLPYLLFVVCITELLAANCEMLGFSSNYKIYSTYFVISTALYFMIFNKIIHWKKRAKHVYHFVAFATVLFSLIDYFYLEAGSFVRYTMTVTLILHIVLSCILLAEIAMDDNRQIRMITEPYFWFASGLLLFSLGTEVTLGLHPFILKNNLMLFGKSLHRVIVPVLNVVMYSCYTIAILLCKARVRLLPS